MNRVIWQRDSYSVSVHFLFVRRGTQLFQNINLGIASKCTCHCTKICRPEHLRTENFCNSVLKAFPNFRVKHNLKVYQNMFLRKTFCPK